MKIVIRYYHDELQPLLCLGSGTRIIKSRAHPIPFFESNSSSQSSNRFSLDSVFCCFVSSSATIPPTYTRQDQAQHIDSGRRETCSSSLCTIISCCNKFVTSDIRIAILDHHAHHNQDNYPENRQRAAANRA